MEASKFTGRKAVCDYYEECLGYDGKYCANCKFYSYPENDKEEVKNEDK